jgi:Rps23 Pro-64 3,4-dihydroxylase Tpa1-like proline 4-hydroxylase
MSNVKRIHPIFNRCVIFNTTKKSVHGHPEALCVPDDDLHRRSIAVYYYTKNYNKELDFEGDPAHSTIWHKTPDSG